MLGLEVLQHYTVKYVELEDRITASVNGMIAPLDRDRLSKLGWIMTGDGTCYFTKTKEPNGSVDETEEYITQPVKLNYEE